MSQQMEIPFGKREIPLSRSGDPITSFMAADDLIKSGGLNRQCQEVLGYLKRYVKAYGQYPTSAELAAFAQKENPKIDRYVTARRLNDLAKHYDLAEQIKDSEGALVKRICSICHKMSVVWGEK